MTETNLYSSASLPKIYASYPSESGLQRVLLLCLAAAAAIYTVRYAPEIITTLDTMDKQLMLALNFTGSAMADRWWSAVSAKTFCIPMAAGLIAVVATQSGGLRQAAILTLMTVVVVTLTDQISSSVIKPLVARPRPSHDPSICMLLHYVGNYRGGRFGFVSGHAANGFGLATWLMLIFQSNRRARLLFPLPAILVGYSRIYLGVHYPGDVLCGAIIGVSIAAATYYACKHLFGKAEMKISDKRHILPIVIIATLMVELAICAA